MSDATQPDDDIGLPPGDDGGTEYQATDFKRGGGRGGAGYMWFACRNAQEDRILPLANLREMEPGAASDKLAVLHFSGMKVELHGTALRLVVYRIFLGRCTSAHEIRPGQKPKKPGDPVIERIVFRVPPKDKAPEHEQETKQRMAEKH